MESENRVVVLIDMDCFYCQVEEKLNPELAGKPIAVVQYNPWKGGGIIAVNYVARARGVTRHMRGDEAKAKCPEIELPSVPCSRGKADITKYRDAGKDVAKVLQKFTSLLERASIDEAYLDITAPVQKRLSSLNVESISTDMIPNTYALGYENVGEFVADVHNGASDSIDFEYEHAKRLLVGALLVTEIRAAVYEETGYRCSAGIAHNKILAKLVCGMNKPNKQTILPKHSISILYKSLPVRKVKHLGGKFGDTVCQILRINTMGELQSFSEKELQNKFDEKNGTWLYNIARGIDLDPVQARFNPKSIGCCKQFRGKAALLDLESVKKWLKDLGDEIEDRLEKDSLENNRTPKQMVVSFSSRLGDSRDTSSSRSYNFTPDDELCGDLFSSKAFEMVMDSSEGAKPKDGENNRRLKAPIEFLGISVGKFQDHTETKKTRKINDYFAAGASKSNESGTSKEKQTMLNQNKKNNGKEYILQKFFQAAATKCKEENMTECKGTCNACPVIEASLDKQESFFARMLNKKLDVDSVSVDSDVNKAAKPNTPVCDVVQCGEDSVDTDYSSSTINMEINKSITLFPDDPAQVDKIDNMRQLLNTTKMENIQDTSSDTTDIPSLHDDEPQENVNPNITPTKDIDTMKCPDCGKDIPVNTIEVHSDYHLALNLREEERRQVRNERKDNVKKKPPEEPKPRQNSSKKSEDNKTKPEKLTSITNFFAKLDETVPTDTCTECGKKVPLDQLTEHLDFHEAQKLSKILNGRLSTPTPVNVSTNKRKRKSTSPAKKLKIPNCKSIDSFFK